MIYTKENLIGVKFMVSDNSIVYTITKHPSPLRVFVKWNEDDKDKSTNYDMNRVILNLMDNTWKPVKLSEKELIEKLLRDYPPGTECDNTNLGYHCKFTVHSLCSYNDTIEEIVIKTKSGSLYTIYLKGIWATITKSVTKSENNNYLIY